jgi:competence protein ComEA
MEEFDDRSLPARLDACLLKFDEWRDRPLVAVAATALVVLVIGVGWWIGRPTAARPVDELIPQIALETTMPTRPPEIDLVIHVAGAVGQPGVYALGPGSRVLDAIDAAGGALSEADLDQLNLAAELRDGVQVRVPLVGEILTSARGFDFAGLDSGETDGPVDINRSNARQLEALPGIGPSTAAAIVAYRDDNGAFGSVDGLLSVPGIGPAKLEGLSDRAVVG